ATPGSDGWPPPAPEDSLLPDAGGRIEGSAGRLRSTCWPAKNDSVTKITPRTPTSGPIQPEARRPVLFRRSAPSMGVGAAAGKAIAPLAVGLITGMATVRESASAGAEDWPCPMAAIASASCIAV